MWTTRLCQAVLVALLPVLAGAQDNELGWLAGCWISDDGFAREIWVEERDGSMAGFSTTIRDGEIVFYEVLTIKRNSRDRWIYSAYPSNQAAVSFAARETDTSRIVFLNASHDYPQVIEYSVENDALTAVISYLGGANARRFDKRRCATGDDADNTTESDAAAEPEV
ncbi:MAG: DUF6265 family protein [Pseudomonadota bacterium]